MHNHTGPAGMHHAAHHRALDMHNAAHRSAVDHMRRRVEHDRITPGPHLSRGTGGSLAGVGTVFQAVMSLLILGVVVGVVLMVINPGGPAWLEQVGQDLDGLVRTITGSGS